MSKYVIDQVRRGSHRPFSRDGEQLPLVHTAAVAMTATFTDVDDPGGVGRLVGLGARPRHRLHRLGLTDARRRRVERKTRQKAVRDAKGVPRTTPTPWTSGR